MDQSDLPVIKAYCHVVLLSPHFRQNLLITGGEFFKIVEVISLNN